MRLRREHARRLVPFIRRLVTPSRIGAKLAFFATDWVDYHAQHRPDALAFGCAEDGTRPTWAELEQRVAGLAATLRGLGVGHGDRVALIAENHPRVFEVQFACMRLGALFVPLNWRLHTAEIEEICLDAQPRIIVYDGVWAEAALEVATTAADAEPAAADHAFRRDSTDVPAHR
ncbi:AMP-binding protein [Mycolicibacterium vulneris]|uniref:AMP-binding protein n=1 Tax=Mycolicibacterium vulneris TaxID=547163 RepID=UPI001FE5792C|nr:AMP-binding protein [Mycolicibacterium vulneris]